MRNADILKHKHAIRELCRAIEALVQLDPDAWTESLWSAYELGRQTLCEPIVTLPGGDSDSGGKHFHFLDFDPDEEECYWCEEQATARAEGLVPAEVSP